MSKAKNKILTVKIPINEDKLCLIALVVILIAALIAATVMIVSIYYSPDLNPNLINYDNPSSVSPNYSENGGRPGLFYGSPGLVR